MINLLNNFEDNVLATDGTNAKDIYSNDDFLLGREGNLAVYYSPFDYVNTSARIVLVGITPGLQQAGNALVAARQALASGCSTHEAARMAKESASFSGPMRSNLVAMLDSFDINNVLGIETCALLFSSHSHLVHYTSVLRYPVLKDGKNYSGNPSYLRNLFLKKFFLDYFATEASMLSNALFVPLGTKVAEGLQYLVNQGILAEERVLFGLQHPSGANNERIAYLLGNKSRADLSARTNADVIDKARADLEGKIQVHLPASGARNSKSG